MYKCARNISKCHPNHLCIFRLANAFALDIGYSFCFEFYIGVYVMGFLASTLNWMKQIFPPIQSVAPATLYNFMYTRINIYIQSIPCHLH